MWNNKIGHVAIFPSLLKLKAVQSLVSVYQCISPICSYHKPDLSSDSLYYGLLIAPSKERFFKKKKILVIS